MAEIQSQGFEGEPPRWRNDGGGRQDRPDSRNERPARTEAESRLRPLTALRGMALVALMSVVLFLCLSGEPTPAQTKPEDAYSPDLFPALEARLQHFYLEQGRIQPRALMRNAFAALENAVDEVYVENSDPSRPYIEVHANNHVRVFRLASVEKLRQAVNMLETVFAFLQTSYDGESPISDIQYAVANGFLSGLDPHTLVFSPKAFKDFSVHIEGEIFGVGMYVGTRDGKLKVIEVLKGTPAARAGFKKNDLIAKIGDESTINMTVSEAVEKIRGPRKSKVILTIKRESKAKPDTLETIPISVERDRVVIKSVESKLITDWGFGGKKRSLADEGKGVGYVKITNFDKNTTPSLRRHLQQLGEENGKPLAGLILDFRGNSGGLLTQAVEMSDLFLRKGTIVVTHSRLRPLQVTEAEDDETEPRYPIVVLSDTSSASGAEIVVGALQKNNRAVVLGTRTFGKGSVQQLHHLPRGAQLKITVSEYLLPGKVSIQSTGVIPDIMAQAVRLTSNNENMALYSRGHSPTEKDYERHLISRFAKKEVPSAQLKYLFDPEDYDPDNDPFVSGDLRPTEDKLVVVALRLLEISDKPFTRKTFLEAKKSEIMELKGDLFDEIVERFGKLEIDWTEGKNPAKPQLELVLSTKRIQEPSKDKDDPIPVNKLLVTARLTNKGDAPVYRVKGISRSESGYLKNLEFLFGKINPGKTIERSARVRLPYFPIARNDLMRVELSSGEPVRMNDDDEPVFDVMSEASTEVRLDGVDRPKFSFKVSLVDADDQDALTSLGVGSDATFRVRLKNTGSATAYKGVVILRNETGRQVFLKKGRIEFTELKPGAETEAEFDFNVREGADVDEYEFEIAAVDSFSGATLVRKVAIPRKGNEDVSHFKNDVWVEAPVVNAALDDGKSPNIVVTDAKEIQLTAEVKSPTSVPFKYWVTRSSIASKDIYPDKIMFDDSKGSSKAKWKTSVPIEKGLNVVSVVAKDRDGLETRRNLFVRRP